MKKYKMLAITISLVVLLTMIAGCTKSEGFFPDKNLEAAVRVALDKLLGEKITTDDLTDLTKLSAGDSNITDLAGIEYCINLNEFDLSNNKISDILPLLSLDNLVHLDLENNQISQIPAPCTFFALVTLNLSGRLTIHMPLWLQQQTFTTGVMIVPACMTRRCCCSAI